MRHGSGLEESWSLVTVSECDDRYKDREATFVVALDLGSIDKVVGFLLSFLEFLDLGSIGVFGFICYGLAGRFMYVIVFFVFVIMC